MVGGPPRLTALHPRQGWLRERPSDAPPIWNRLRGANHRRADGVGRDDSASRPGSRGPPNAARTSQAPDRRSRAAAALRMLRERPTRDGRTDARSACSASVRPATGGRTPCASLSSRGATSIGCLGAERRSRTRSALSGPSGRCIRGSTRRVTGGAAQRVPISPRRVARDADPVGARHRADAVHGLRSGFSPVWRPRTAMHPRPGRWVGAARVLDPAAGYPRSPASLRRRHARTRLGGRRPSRP